ncbi:MAG: nucleotidyltransferase domain-containing protein [Phormidesmis sp.]
MAVPHKRLYERLRVSPDELRHFCERSPIAELAFFGSVLREDFRSDSDIDILVRLVPDDGMSLMDFVGLEYQFEALFQRKVDLVERKLVETDPNWIRRQEILNHFQRMFEKSKVDYQFQIS